MRLKPQYKKNQASFIHPPWHIHTHKLWQEAIPLAPSTWHSDWCWATCSSPYTTLKKPRVSGWYYSGTSWKSKSKCHISIWLVAMCHPRHNMHRYPHAHKPPSSQWKPFLFSCTVRAAAWDDPSVQLFPCHNAPWLSPTVPIYSSNTHNARMSNKTCPCLMKLICVFFFFGLCNIY